MVCSPRELLVRRLFERDHSQDHAPACTHREQGHRCGDEQGKMNGRVPGQHVPGHRTPTGRSTRGITRASIVKKLPTEIDVFPSNASALRR